MIKILNRELPNAYNGSYLRYRGRTYTLIPETVKGYCKDCVFEYKNQNGCGSALTDYCRQGFIVKEIK